MTEFPSVPNKISHRDLKSLLNSAFKDSQIVESDQDVVAQPDAFEELLSGWAQTSQQLLEVLKDKDSHYFKHLKPKQIMALGALQAHLTLAIQAKFAIDQEQ